MILPIFITTSSQFSCISSFDIINVISSFDVINDLRQCPHTYGKVARLSGKKARKSGKKAHISGKGTRTSGNGWRTRGSNPVQLGNNWCSLPLGQGASLDIINELGSKWAHSCNLTYEPNTNQVLYYDKLSQPKSNLIIEGLGWPF